MSDVRLQQLRGLFETAVELDPNERDAWLAACVESDPELGASLARLLDRDRELTGVSTQRPFVPPRAAFDDERLFAGASVGAYTLEEEIGRGGMGRVFRAHRSGARTRDPVAIKVLRRDRVNPALLRRFSTERTILAALDHPGIARLIDAGTTDDGIPFVVMELVRGSAMLEWCDRRKLGLWRRLELFRKVLAAVAHAHASLVVHRDIKSGNVLVTDNGEPRLLDFGIAKPLGPVGDADLTATNERFVSLFTAAPEQLEGGSVTTACDIYALGMLLYELLSGRAPYDFDTMTPGEVDSAVRLVPPPPMTSRVGDADLAITRSRGLGKPRELRAGLRGDIEHIVQRCLRKQPEERYASIDQLDHDIDHAMLGLPIRERQSDGWYRWSRFLGRHRVSAAMFALMLLAGVAALVVGVREAHRLTAERDRADRAASLFAQAFADANPLEFVEPGLSARAILESARPRLEALYRTQPETYADVAGRLAQAELAIGAFARASELAQRAISALTQVRGSGAELAALLTLDARARIGMGDYAAADVLLDWAERQGGTALPAWKLAKGRLLFRREQCDAAIELLEDALAGRGDATDETSVALHRELAEVLRAAQRPNDAVKRLDRLIGLLEAHPAGAGAQLIASRLQRLDALRDAGSPPEAVLVEARQLVGDEENGAGPVATAVRNRLSAGASLLPPSLAHCNPAPEVR